MKKKDEYPLRWDETWDDNDNSIWEAYGPYTDEEGCPEFMFRVEQQLVNNKIEYFESSDMELRPDEFEPRTWESFDAAKAEMQKDANSIMKEHRDETSSGASETS